MLTGKGFDNVYNLTGGIRAWDGQTASGPAEMGMTILKGDESSEEIIIIAYGMEQGLKEFYITMTESIHDSEIKEFFFELASIEDKHKQKLYDVYASIDKSVSDKTIFESCIVSDMMEGGFTTEEFLKNNREVLKTVPDTINMAMMLEAQALDLYLRYSQKIEDEAGKHILYDIAEEEKAHLRALGELMDAKGINISKR